MRDRAAGFEAATFADHNRYRKGRTITETEYRVNHDIRASQVRLITDSNDNIGVISIGDALRLAEEKQLDLVEVAPNADPPVCRIMDYGKFQYDKQRKERKARKNQIKVEVKEIQLRPKTDDHHLGFKIKNARRWLQEGKKVRVRIRFRGREITHSNIGLQRLDNIRVELEDVATVEQHPNLEGRDMLMVLAPLAEKQD
jgi:translation initiation factor IF-3